MSKKNNNFFTLRMNPKVKEVLEALAENKNKSCSSTIQELIVREAVETGNHLTCSRPQENLSQAGAR